MHSQIEIRRERNKQSAAKSRANRKATFEKMLATIEQLRLENAALQVQLNSLLPQPIAYIEPWHMEDMPLDLEPVFIA
jgi:hypothetical protein